MTAAIKEASNALIHEREAYEAMRDELIEHHKGKFVVIMKSDLKGAFDSFNAAAMFARKSFGRGPYLIRQVGASESINLPASVAYRPIHAAS